MAFWSKALAKESVENTKNIIETFAIVLTGFFVLWQWGFETYWERETSYIVALDEVNDSNKSVNESGFIRDIERTINESEYCNLEGVVRISNISKAPMHIENTKLSFIPYVKNVCYKKGAKGGSCMISDTASHIVDRNSNNHVKISEDKYSFIIRPVDDQPLFGKSYATRPFNISIPLASFGSQKGLLIKIEQEVGKGCVDSKKPYFSYLNNWGRSCVISKVSFVDTNVCSKT